MCHTQSPVKIINFIIRYFYLLNFFKLEFIYICFILFKVRKCFVVVVVSSVS